MNLRQIEVFRAVMLAGSMTDAARLLHVSQPGISRMIAHIELQLGTALFERRKGKLIPTPEAEGLHAEVELVYRGVERIDDFAKALKEGSTLSLRILASPSTGLEIVPQAVSALADRYPAAKIYLEILPAREMANRLANHEADVAISTLPIEHALLASKTLGTWTLACVFPKGHALEAHRSVSPRDVLKERLVAFGPDTPQGGIIANWSRQYRIRLKSRIEVRSGQTACALAACNAGVAVVDDLTARAYHTDRLLFRPIARSPSFGIFAVTNDHFAHSVLSKDFVNSVADVLKAQRKK